MKKYYVYVKDNLQQFWTIHVCGSNIKEVLLYAKDCFVGGDSFGVKEFIDFENVPNNFSHGTIEAGMKGI